MADDNEPGSEPGADGILHAEPEQKPTPDAATIDEMRGLYQSLVGHITEEKRERLREKAAGIEARMRASVKAAGEGDSDAIAAYDAAKRDLDALNEQMQKLAAQPQAPLLPPGYTDFEARNKSWYGANMVMTDAADAAGRRLYAQGLRGAALYSAVEKEIREAFPHKFQNPRRQAPPAVEGGQGAARETGPKEKKFEDLPPEGKDAFRRFVKRGIYKDTPEGRAAYAADAFAGMEEARNAA